jgi:hypothetical protein
MTHPYLHDGTCAAGHCRVMPDAYCRTCKRWYCTTHAQHANHVDQQPPQRHWTMPSETAQYR